jgi:hypothetical protein
LVARRGLIVAIAIALCSRAGALAFAPPTNLLQSPSLLAKGEPSRWVSREFRGAIYIHVYRQGEELAQRGPDLYAVRYASTTGPQRFTLQISRSG